MALPRPPNGPPGPRGGSGGGTTGSSGAAGTNVTPFSENGGFLASTFFLMLPIFNTQTGATAIAFFNPANFNDPNDGSSYTYRSEDIVVGRMPTVRRVVLVYRDLGVAKLTITVSGTDDNANVISQSSQVQIGNTIPTNIEMTKFVDLSIACFRPQLSFTRALGGGPISIISASLIGEVEDVTL